MTDAMKLRKHIERARNVLAQGTETVRMETHIRWIQEAEDLVNLLSTRLAYAQDALLKMGQVLALAEKADDDLRESRGPAWKVDETYKPRYRSHDVGDPGEWQGI